MTPAFSPGPWMTQGAWVGRSLRSLFEFLYPQCSDHIALKTPSSVKVGCASHDADDPLVLLRREAVVGHHLGRDVGVSVREASTSGGCHDGARRVRSPWPAAVAKRGRRSEVKTPTPSVEPSTASIARSGWGIMPSTFPDAFTMPAMLCHEPLGFASSVASPSASTYRKTTRPSPSSVSSVSPSAS